jgi:type I restriction enzyme S subunit
MKSERYEAYKDSEIKWLSEVPNHWQVVRAKDICQIFVPQRDKPELNEEKGTPWITSDLLENAKIDYKKLKYLVDEGEIKYKRIRKVPANSVLASCIGEFCLTAINQFAVVINQQIQAYSYIKKQSSEFINYQIQANVTRVYYETVATETTIKYINKEKFSFTPLYLPPLPEQKAIAHYLDSKTAQIDRKIDFLTQKATLYSNLKQSLIDETVTRGLDKSVPMTDSGIEWLSEVPNHWKSGRLKDIISALESGVSVNAANLSAQSDESGILKTSCVSICGFNPNENKTILEEEIVRAKCNPRKGNIIISRMNTPELVGASGFIDKDYPNLFLPDRLWQTVFYRHAKINSKWLSYLLIVTRFREVVSFSATGSSPSMKNLSQEKFLKIAIPLPSISEQKEIANYLDTKTAQIDQIIQTINTQIEKLKELRKTLINDVVTGKIKVV